MEKWEWIKGYEGIYRVSDLGNIRSMKYNDNREIQKFKSDTGYMYVNLRKNGKGTKFKVNRLVGQGFLGLDINNRKIFVCHKNDIRDDDRMCNLFLGSALDNVTDCISKGRKPTQTGDNHKKIGQFSKNGELIEEFIGIQATARLFGLDHSHIIRCCRGKAKTAGGFIWKYS